MAVVIVTPAEITKNTPLGGNVDVDKYAFLIVSQQDFELKPILGTALYNKILSDIETLGIDNLTGHYKAIVFDYAKPILINSVFAEYINFGGVSIDNNGIFNVLPQDSQVVDENTIKRLFKSYKSKAQVYVDRLEDYLCSQGNDIPEYTNAQANDYDIDPVRDSNIVGGLYLKRTRQVDIPNYRIYGRNK